MQKIKTQKHEIIQYKHFFTILVCERELTDLNKMGGGVVIING